jgi:hypothetical protein
MVTYREALYVFENEGFSLQFRYSPHKLLNQMISRIVEHSLADQRKTLAWRPPEYHINWSAPNTGCSSNFVSRKSDDGFGDYGRSRKVEVMDSCVDRIEFDGNDDIEPGLLEPERHTARTGK